LKEISVGIVIGLIIYWITSFAFVTNHAILMGLVAFLITLWTNEGLPMGVVSLLPLVFFPSLGVGSFKEVASNYANPIIFLFLGGFLIAIAFEKTGLHKVIAHKILQRFPKTPRGMIYSLMITSAFLSSILSNTTITLMLLPIALFLTENRRLKVRFLIATAYGATIGGVLTPIGTPPNLILFGFLENFSIEHVSFVGWIGMVFPIVFLMLLIVPYILSIGLNNEVIEDKEEEHPFNKKQKQLLFVLSGLVILLLVNSKLGDFYTGLGLSEKLILLSFGLLMFAPKLEFLVWEDTKKLPYEIIFLFGAGFSIAGAFVKSGIALEITHYLSAIQTMPLFFMLFIMALFVSFATEVTSNTAFISIALPILYEFIKVTGVDTQLFLMTATIATSYAFMLPIATAPNAIIISSGVIKIKEMAKIGFLINMIGVIILSIIAYLMW